MISKLGDGREGVKTKFVPRYSQLNFWILREGFPKWQIIQKHTYYHFLKVNNPKGWGRTMWIRRGAEAGLQ